MALPLTRNRTYGPGTPVHSSDLNDLQDRVIALHAQQVANTTIVIPAEHAAALTPPGADTPYMGIGNAWQIGAGDVEPVQYGLIVPQGMQIKSWSLSAYKASSGAETLRGELYKRTGIGPGVVLALVGAQQNNNANAPGVIALGQAGLTQAVAAGEAYVVRAVSLSGAAGDYFGDLTVVYGPPA